MTLHQLNKLSYSQDIEYLWRETLNQGDALLLMEEAILRLQTQEAFLKELSRQKAIKIYALQSDALAYGIQPTLGQILTDEEWVDITLNAITNISW